MTVESCRQDPTATFAWLAENDIRGPGITEVELVDEGVALVTRFAYEQGLLGWTDGSTEVWRVRRRHPLKTLPPAHLVVG